MPVVLLHVGMMWFGRAAGVHGAERGDEGGVFVVFCVVKGRGVGGGLVAMLSVRWSDEACV